MTNNKLNYQQLSLTLDFSAPVKVPSIPLNKQLKNRLGLIKFGRLRLKNEDSLYAIFRKFGDYVFTNGEWNNQDLLNSALTLAKYAAFPSDVREGSGDVVSTSFSDSVLDILQNKGIDWSIAVNLKNDDSFRRFFYVTDNHVLLKRAGQVLRVNVKDGRKYYRFVFQSKKRLIGFGNLVNDIQAQYHKQQNQLSFQPMALHEMLGYLLDSDNWKKTYSYLFMKYVDGNLSEEEYLYKHGTLDGWNSLVQHNAVIDFLRKYFSELYNIVLQVRYDCNVDQRSRAAAWETKKHINQSTKRLIGDSKLNQVTGGLEIDNEVNPDDFKLFEQEVLRVLPLLPTGKCQPVLRLRKLGNYHAYGLYVPRLNNIVLDFRNEDQIAAFSYAGIRSFIHEYGHYLDHQYNDGQLSMKKDFAPLLRNYQEKIRRVDEDYIIDKLHYFMTPTEVFARLFEIYVKSLGFQSLLIKNSKTYQETAEYSVVDKLMMKQVKKYFSEVFPQLSIKKVTSGLQVVASRV